MNVAVLGAGYAGVALAKRLEDRLPEDVELVVVEETGTHLVQHELHRLVRRPSFAEEIVLPLEDLFERAQIRVDRVRAVDHESGTVELADGDPLEYDFAAVCLGAETNYYDLPGVEAHSTPLKRVEDALEIRERFLEVAESGGGSIVVGGAGLSGIQVAGELAEFAREVSGAENEEVEGKGREAKGEGGEAKGEERDAREEIGEARVENGEAQEVLDGELEIVLVEQRDSVAPTFPENFQRAVRAELEARGVVVRTGTTVEAVDVEEVRFTNGERLSYDQLVWTGGIRGSDALGGERPQVRPTMRLGDGTFVVGDAAAVVDAEGRAVPASAQSAVREARLVADNIVRLVEHAKKGDEMFEPRLERFVFNSPGWLVSVGDGAVAQVGPAVFRGAAAKALKTTVGAGYLSSVGAHRRVADFVSEELGRGD